MYRGDVFATLKRLIDRRERDRWRTAVAFAEAWLRRDTLREILFGVAYTQFEPEPDADGFWGSDDELPVDPWDEELDVATDFDPAPLEPLSDVEEAAGRRTTALSRRALAPNASRKRERRRRERESTDLRADRTAPSVRV